MMMGENSTGVPASLLADEYRPAADVPASGSATRSDSGGSSSDTSSPRPTRRMRCADTSAFGNASSRVPPGGASHSVRFTRRAVTTKVPSPSWRAEISISPSSLTWRRLMPPSSFTAAGNTNGNRIMPANNSPTECTGTATSRSTASCQAGSWLPLVRTTSWRKRAFTSTEVSAVPSTMNSALHRAGLDTRLELTVRLRVDHAKVEPLPILDRRGPVRVEHVPLVEQRGGDAIDRVGAHTVASSSTASRSRSTACSHVGIPRSTL